MPRALLSVYNKTDLLKLASTLVDLGWELVASGGTERSLREAGIPVTAVEKLTGQPEMLGGRVKTLHPAIHAGILVRDTASDMAELASFDYPLFDMVVCNLYPFQETVAQKSVTLQDAVEQIDIGGVALLRAAAKNFLRVAAVCDPADYHKIIAEVKAGGQVDLPTRRNLAVKAFAHTRDYDTAIHAFLSREIAPAPSSDELPEHLSLGFHRIETLRYGENPHQMAAFYSHEAASGPLGGEVLGGKALSYNNILDLDAAWRAVSMFNAPTVVIVKHLTPIGIASADSIAEAYPQAFAADEVSAYGGVIAVNRMVDDNFVAILGSLFVEAIAAPNFSPTAQATLNNGRKNCRLVRVPFPYDGHDYDIRSVHRGLLVQRADMGDPEGTPMKTVTSRPPTPQELDALQFAWKAVQHVKSNSIVLAIPGATVGVGGGLPSRVDAVALAVRKAGSHAQGAVMASDAFFPFADGIEAAAQAGVTAVIQPGGSIRDSEIIEAANRAGMAMVFTGMRHFRH